MESGEIRKSIDDLIDKDIQNTIITLDNQLALEIERLQRQQHSVEGSSEVYCVSGMLFKKVYDKLIALLKNM